MKAALNGRTQIILIILILLNFSCIKQQLQQDVEGTWLSQDSDTLELFQGNVRGPAGLGQYEVVDDSILEFSQIGSISMKYKVIKVKKDTLILRALLWSSDTLVLTKLDKQK